MTNLPLLSILTFLPLIGLPFIIIGKLINSENYEIISKYIALFVSLIAFIISLIILYNFDISTSNFQISILFILLSTFLTPICIIASWNIINDRVDYYMCSFLILETLMIGTFCALDIVLFYLFFESVLIPMFVIIGVWGGERRVYSAFKFFLYTLLGSVLMLVAIIYIVLISGTTELPVIYEVFNIDHGVIQNLLWLAFFASNCWISYTCSNFAKDGWIWFFKIFIAIAT